MATANPTSDGDSKEAPDGKQPIELGELTVPNIGVFDLHLEESNREYEITAFPIDYEESDGNHGIQIEETIRFPGGAFTTYHSFSPEEARELAARLTAAADKLGHVPEEDAPQPAEL